MAGVALQQAIDFGAGGRFWGQLLARRQADRVGLGRQHVRLRDAATGAPYSEPLKGHSGCVRSIAFSSDSKSNTTPTPLSYAAEEGHEAVVKLLLENPVDMDSKSNTGQTPLSYATENGHQASVTLLSSKNKVSMEAWSSPKRHGSDADTSFSSLLSITMA
jgi:hypothetical protein